MPCIIQSRRQQLGTSWGKCSVKWCYAVQCVQSSTGLFMSKVKPNLKRN